MKLKQLVRVIHNLFYDFKYGGFLGGIKKTPYAMIGAYDTANSDYYAMSKIFEGKIKTNDVLVDIGCGKGRVINYWLTNFPNNKIIGIELDNMISKKVSRRLASFKNVTILSGNAINLIPDNASLFYLFNPFNCDVMKDFKESLKSKFFEENTTSWIHFFVIIYYNPTCAETYLNDPKFTCSEIEMPIGYHKCLLISPSIT